jgi:hypothetical protein
VLACWAQLRIVCKVVGFNHTIQYTYCGVGGGPVGAYRTRWWLFCFTALASLTEGNRNGLLLGTTLLHHLGDVFGDRLL